MSRRSGTEDSLRLRSSWLEAGRGRKLAVRDAHGLEERAHLAFGLSDQAGASRLERFRPIRSRALRERLGSQIDSDRAQEIALVDRAVDYRPGRACASRHRSEIDMRGQVTVARRGE